MMKKIEAEFTYSKKLKQLVIVSGLFEIEICPKLYKITVKQGYFLGMRYCDYINKWW